MDAKSEPETRPRRHKPVGPMVSALFHLVLIAVLSSYVVQVQRLPDQLVVVQPRLYEIQLQAPDLNEPDEAAAEDAEEANEALQQPEEQAEVVEEVELVEEVVEPILPPVEVVETVEEVEAEARVPIGEIRLPAARPRMAVKVKPPVAPMPRIAMAPVEDEVRLRLEPVDAAAVLGLVSAPMDLPARFSGRSAAGRAAAASKHGAIEGNEDAVLKALDWLAETQLEDGSWEHHPGHTGLALLCFLGHGETPASEQYGDTVRNAIQWLAGSILDWETLYARRRLSDVRSYHAYSQAIATYALAEAYGITQIPFLVEPMEKGIELILQGQQPDGGWNYEYSKMRRWDTSVVAWQIQALRAADLAGSMNSMLPLALEKTADFLKEACYVPLKGDGGRFVYSPVLQENHLSGNMTGVGVLTLQLLGEGRAPESTSALKSMLAKRTPTWEKAKFRWSATAAANAYGWYYDTQAVFNGTGGAGSGWAHYNKLFQEVLIDNQDPKGYWTHKEYFKIGGETLSGRILATAFACLQLEVHYRYLPTYNVGNDSIQTAEGQSDPDNTLKLW